MRVRPAQFKLGAWVYYFCPRHRMGKSPKWERYYDGPYLVIGVIGSVTYKIQKSARARPMVVHVDKLKMFRGEEPARWITVAGDDNLTTSVPNADLRDLSTRIDATTSSDAVPDDGELVLESLGTGQSPKRLRPVRDVKKPSRYRD